MHEGHCHRRRRLHRLGRSCRHLVASARARVVNLDKLTYAGNLDIAGAASRDSPRYAFVQADICDRARDATRCSREHRPRRGRCTSPPRATSTARSTAPASSSQTNVVGTFALLEAARGYWRSAAAAERKARFRFLHVSTDEVYGSLGRGPASSPRRRRYEPELALFGLSKAASDHLVRAWHHTYGLPVADDQLLEQLRALPVPREADPADDPQRARGQAAAGLRRRAERARLAVRRRPRARALRGARARRAGRDLQRRRRQRAHQPRRRAGDLRRCSTSCARAATARARDADHLRHRPAGPRPPLRDRRRKIERELGWKPQETLRDRPAQDGPLVSRQRAVVARVCARTATTASASAFCTASSSSGPWSDGACAKRNS